MSYDHSSKAGNLGDVWKHSVLVALVDAVPKKSESFRYVECHAGAPIHKLAEKGEWSRGVGRIDRRAACDSAYAAMAREWLGRNLRERGLGLPPDPEQSGTTGSSLVAHTTAVESAPG